MVIYEKDAIVHPYVSEYIRNEFNKSEGILGELEDYAKLNEVPIVHIETAQLLKTLVMTKQPKKILEIGCAIGYSSILMSKACPNCHITTVEYDEDMVLKARENIKKAGLEDKIEVVFADATEYLTYKSGDEKYDMIFLDGPKAHYVLMLEDCLRIMNPGGLLVADNILYKGMTATDKLVIRRKITIVKRLRRFVHEITHRDDLASSIVPIGDGVTITVKK